MKFAVDSAHREYFRNHLSIEFENFLTSENVERFKQEIKKAWESRVSGGNFEKASPEKLFMMGRDLRRSETLLSKLLQKYQFASIVADLTEEKAMRIGYDQYLPASPLHFDKFPNDSPYIKFLQSNSTLEATSSIEGLLSGLLICLKDSSKPSSLFPKKAGNIVCFAPTAHFDLAQTDGEYLLIVYTRAMAVYTLQEKDPHAYALKHLGYGYGDLLSNKFNPLIRF